MKVLTQSIIKTGFPAPLSAPLPLFLSPRYLSPTGASGSIIWSIETGHFQGGLLAMQYLTVSTPACRLASRL